MRGTQIRSGIPDGANGSGEPLPRPLLRPSPSANLVGNWKGDPLGPQVAAPSGLPNRNSVVLLRSIPAAICDRRRKRASGAANRPPLRHNTSEMGYDETNAAFLFGCPRRLRIDVMMAEL